MEALTHEQLSALELEIQPDWLLTLDEQQARAVLAMAKRYAWLRDRYAHARGQTPDQIDKTIDERMT